MGVSAVDPFKPDAHDHGCCVHRAIEQAVALCAKRGSRLTDLRRSVLELVWHSHAPIGAYQILDQLATSRGRAAPPTIYRALEFLSREGLVHRIESLNAYVGCASPTLPHEPYFFICRACGDAAEFDDEELTATLTRCVRRASFQVDSSKIELSGLCARCSANPVAA